jgi:hypothetical protein
VRDHESACSPAACARCCCSAPTAPTCAMAPHPACRTSTARPSTACRSGIGVGCCGEAVHSGRRVVADSWTCTPTGTAFRDLAQRAGLQACWSEPVIGSRRHRAGHLCRLPARARFARARGGRPHAVRGAAGGHRHHARQHHAGAAQQRTAPARHPAGHARHGVAEGPGRRLPLLQRGLCAHGRACRSSRSSAGATTTSPPPTGPNCSGSRTGRCWAAASPEPGALDDDPRHRRACADRADQDAAVRRRGPRRRRARRGARHHADQAGRPAPWPSSSG